MVGFCACADQVTRARQSLGATSPIPLTFPPDTIPSMPEDTLVAPIATTVATTARVASLGAGGSSGDDRSVAKLRPKVLCNGHWRIDVTHEFYVNRRRFDTISSFPLQSQLWRAVRLMSQSISLIHLFNIAFVNHARWR